METMEFQSRLAIFLTCNNYYSRYIVWLNEWIEIIENEKEITMIRDDLFERTFLNNNDRSNNDSCAGIVWSPFIF